MILHSVAFLAGAAILAAVTHMTVLHTGGYGSPHSYVVIAVAAGVGIGSVCYTMARAQKQWALARCLLVCIVAGELFGLQQTTTRLVAASLAQQTPLREYAEDARESQGRRRSGTEGGGHSRHLRRGS